MYRKVVVPDKSLKPIIEKLKDYFKKRKEVVFAFLFGSTIRNQIHKNSDIDIGIYFYPAGDKIEIEEDVRYECEEEIWEDIEKLLKKEVDLVVLNRAPSTICLSAIRGIPVLIKNWEIYLKFMEIVVSEGIDYQEMIISEFERKIENEKRDKKKDY